MLVLVATRRTVLVTGASRGIGRAIALELGRAGARVLVGARDLEACRRVAGGIRDAGGEAEVLALDVAKPTAAESLADHGPIDWLVNNAGIVESAPLGRSDEALVASHMEVNFHGARRLAHALWPQMRARAHGRIVNVASSAGLRGYAYASAYCASKFALVGWTLAAADELAGSGVTVNAVCPHYVDSPMLEAAVMNIVKKTGRNADDVRAFMAAQNPGGRLVEPEAVARAVRELLEGEENGVLVELDGSRTLRHLPNERSTAPGDLLAREPRERRPKGRDA
jgi:NAD(P)-dependent dehydrogenase (short-subunit alcohol dehydrogenase family)